MSAIARTLGLLLGCASLIIACSQPRPAPAETEADAPAEEDQVDLVDDSTVSAVDASADQIDAGETAGLGDAETSDSTPPPPCNPADCDDGWVCTADSCKAGVCLHVPMDSTPCDDSDPCTVGEGCVEGSCGGGGEANCDDGNSCTLDSCDTGQGCAHKPTLAACSDGDACTTGEACKAGTCAGGTPMFCGDGNFCTDDSCDSAKGCVFTPNSAPCDSDSNVCTVDTCAGGKCAYLPVAGTGTACDDGSPCTQEDHCEKGKCVGAAAVWTVDWDGVSAPQGFGVRTDLGVATGTQDAGYVIDWGGKVLWTTPFPIISAAATTSGWVFLKANPINLVFATANGTLGPQLPLPALGTAITGVPTTGPDDSIFMEVVKTPGVWQIAKVDQTGAVATTWDLPEQFSPAGNPIPHGAGNFLWPCIDDTKFQARLCHFQPATGVFAAFPSPVLPPLQYPYYGWGMPQSVIEASDKTLYIVQARLTEPKPGTVAVYLWHTTPAGEPLWSLVLPIPGQPSDSDQGFAAIASLADGTVEVWANPLYSKAWGNFNQGYTSWRISADGSVIWRQDEALKRRLATGITGKGYGVVAPCSYFAGTITPPRVTRSDAFGNITCADSGPCWDKPASYCDDGDPCTNDLCGVWWNGCHHTPFAEGAPCKPGKTCKKGQCVP